MIGAAVSRRAERETDCGECGKPIARGERMFRQTCKQNGEFHILEVCFECNLPVARERWLARLARFLKKHC